LAFLAFLTVLALLAVFDFVVVFGFGLDAMSGVTSSSGRPRLEPRLTFQGFPQVGQL
jgi:hypothetical protein